MIEEDDTPFDNSPYLRAYDFLKHLTGISLVSLGGILGLLGGQGPEVPKVKLIILTVLVGIAGASSLFTAATIIGTIDLEEPKRISIKAVRIGMQIAVWSLTLGVGAAIQTFASVLM